MEKQINQKEEEGQRMIAILSTIIILPYNA
jgi:hypothetical protein